MVFRISIILILSTCCARAQGIGDWFNQKAKLKQNYLAQIAALNSFRAELKQGYNIATKGLNGIKEISSSELDLHTAYYESLNKSKGSPAVIIDLQERINTVWLQQNGPVKNKVLGECRKDLDELQSLMTDGQLALTDQQRLDRLAAMEARQKDRYYFTRHYTASQKLFEAQRQRETIETNTLKQLYEIH